MTKKILLILLMFTGIGLSQINPLIRLKNLTDSLSHYASKTYLNAFIFDSTGISAAIELLVNPDSIYSKMAGWVTPEMFAVVNDSVSDATSALQSAIIYAQTNGLKLKTHGKYRITSTLTIDNHRSLVWDGGGTSWTNGSGNVGSGGTIIYSDINTNSSAIKITGGVDGNFIVLSNMRITSGQEAWHGNADIRSDENIGIEINSGHHGKLENLIIDGFDSCGVLAKNSYYWDYQSLFFRYNGYGFIDDGANTYVLYNCNAQYNDVGFAYPDNIIGGSTQGSFYSGIKLGLYAGYRASITNHYFESNNLSRDWGNADIYGDSLAYGELSLNGSIYFATIYDSTMPGGWDKPTHNIKGKFNNLSIYGVTRYFSVNPWYNFKFNGNTTIYDYGNDPMYEPDKNTLDFTNVTYYRPANDIGADTLTVNYTTPSVFGQNKWFTQNTLETKITNFSNGFPGQQLIIVINDDLTTFDFSNSSLIGNQGQDFTAQTGDAIKATKQGSLWYCSILHKDDSGIYTYDLNVENDATVVGNLSLPNIQTNSTGLNANELYADPFSNQVYYAKGANLILSGEFNDWTGTYRAATPDGWIIGIPQDTNHFYFANNANRLQIISDDNKNWTFEYRGVSEDEYAVIGEKYRYSFDIISWASDTLNISVCGTNINQPGYIPLTPGHYTGEVTATYNRLFGFWVYDTTNVIVDNIRVWQTVGGAKEPPTFINNLPYVNNFFNPATIDTLSIFRTDIAISIDSIQLRTNDSIGVKGTFGSLGLGNTCFNTYMNVSGWNTITSFNDATIPAGNEVYFYFTYIGDTATYLKWKIYWRHQ
jgi:hypothetical protein